jgi:eukaryotic-like serine/threonine-protein kinase
MGTRGLHPGQLLGRHRLIERIAAGGMAEVFLARQEGPEGFSRSVAVKVVHPDHDDPDILLSLIDEARVAAQLSHPNIVQIIELGGLDDSFFLVMEFLDGWPVDELLKLARAAEPLPLDAIVDLGQQLLDALGYAHTAQDEAGAAMEVVHRDIKPSNLVVDGRGLLKVVDFGIARAASIERRTATGIGKGTPAYMAPEQLYGEETGPPSDLYAVGVLLFELATRKRLFTADSIIALVGRRQQGYRDEDEALLIESAPSLAPIVRKALSREPSDRYNDAAAMTDALAELSDVRPRKGVRGWLDALVGVDERAFRSSTASQPIETIDGTDAVDWRPSGSATVPKDLGSAPPTRKQGGDLPRAAGTDPAAPRADVSQTRLQRVPDATIDEGDVDVPGPRGRPWWLLVPVVLVIGWLFRPSSDVPAPTPTPVFAPAPSPEAIPAPSPEVTPALPSSTPRAVFATPSPKPASTPSPTPSPTPVKEPPPPPTRPPVSTAVSPGSLFVNMVGQSGFVQVAGHGRKPTRKPFSLPPGVHRVQLLDLDGGELRAFSVKIGIGQTSRCVWRKTPSGLTFVPDPEGAPCTVLSD